MNNYACRVDLIVVLQQMRDGRIDLFSSQCKTDLN